MTSNVHIVFDDPASATRAVRKLETSTEVDDPIERFVVRTPLRQDGFSVAFSQARAGALFGLIGTGGLGGSRVDAMRLQIAAHDARSAG